MNAMLMRGLVAAVAGLVFCANVWAQGAYPTKTVTLVVPYSAGGRKSVV